MLQLRPSDPKEARPASKSKGELFEDQSPVSIARLHPSRLDKLDHGIPRVCVAQRQPAEQPRRLDERARSQAPRLGAAREAGVTRDFNMTAPSIAVHGPPRPSNPPNAGVGAHPQATVAERRAGGVLVDPASPHGGMAVGEWKPTPSVGGNNWSRCASGVRGPASTDRAASVLEVGQLRARSAKRRSELLHEQQANIGKSQPELR